MSKTIGVTGSIMLLFAGIEAAFIVGFKVSLLPMTSFCLLEAHSDLPSSTEPLLCLQVSSQLWPCSPPLG